MNKNEKRDSLAEVADEITALLADHEKRARRYATLRDAAKRAEKEAADERAAALEAGDDPENFAELTTAIIAAREQAKAAEEELKKITDAPAVTPAEYDRLKGLIFDYVEIERQAFIDMLAIHAGVLKEEAAKLAAYTERANEALNRLQFDAFRDHNYDEERNGRIYAHIARPECVDNSGIIHLARSLALSPLLSGRVVFKSNVELATWNGDGSESVEE